MPKRHGTDEHTPSACTEFEIMTMLGNREIEYLKEACDALNLTLTSRQETQFQQYYALLIETNKVMNLTAITQPHEVVVKHFLDSLSIVRAPQAAALAEGTVLDMGTGAGFPGIPLKIMFPEAEFVLADSLGKRVRFLETVIEQCGLKGITAIHTRAEELGRNKNHREHYDYCVSRAVAALPVLSEYCLPFVRLGGYFISYKSINVDTELSESEHAISVLGGKLHKAVRFQLDPDRKQEAGEPGEKQDETAYERTLLVIEKIKHTPAAFPRKAGTPKKDPL